MLNGEKTWTIMNVFGGYAFVLGPGGRIYQWFKLF
jgi:hypothetical protein